MEAQVIVRDSSGRYLPIVTSTMQNQVAVHMLRQMEDNNQALVTRSRIISIIELESGKHSIQTLHNKLKAEGLNVSFETVANLVTDLRSQRLVFKDEQKFLHDTFDE